MSGTILTLHPQGKQGVNISRQKYDVVAAAILSTLKAHGEFFTDLSRAVEDRLGGHFDGSIMWYVITVKLDLEARGELKRVPNSSPQKIVLV